MNIFIIKCIWWILQIGLAMWMGCLIFLTGQDIIDNPLVVSLENTNYHIKNVPFPAVAICNVNKISKARIKQYASEISVKLRISMNTVLEDLYNLRYLYDFNTDNTNDLVRIQTMIEKYATLINSTNTVYDTMKSLATPCDELLEKCVWKTVNYNCSELFKLRSTFNGFCCTFNYLKSFNKTEKVQRLSNKGKDNGLIVTVRNDVDDYFFPAMSGVGLSVQIFNPADYPDITSGNLLLQLLQVGTVAFFSLEPRKFYSVDEIRKYPVHLRNCMFHDERLTVFGNYSYSNCLVECRMASIFALCECIPFFMPYERNHSCTLSNIRCLSKYQDKWRNLYPFGFYSDELDKEKENSLDCEYCYSDCTTVNYHLRFSSVPFNAHHKDIMKLNRYNVIHVYYERSRAKLYKQDVVYYWYETISNLGGIVGIFLGFSFISVIEMLQSIGRKIVHSIRNLSKSTS